MTGSQPSRNLKFSKENENVCLIVSKNGCYFTLGSLISPCHSLHQEVDFLSLESCLVLMKRKQQKRYSETMEPKLYEDWQLPFLFWCPAPLWKESLPQNLRSLNGRGSDRSQGLSQTIFTFLILFSVQQSLNSTQEVKY